MPNRQVPDLVDIKHRSKGILQLFESQDVLRTGFRPGGCVAASLALW
jgi:hypothetical protein